MKPQRKLSDGILPCGRCGHEPRIFRSLLQESYYADCPHCLWRFMGTESHPTVVDTIVAWNSLSAATHPEPEDYLELLEECRQQVDDKYPRGETQTDHIFYIMSRGQLKQWLDMHDLMFELRKEFGDHDD